MIFDYEEILEGGLRYTENVPDRNEKLPGFLRAIWSTKEMPAVFCRLWADGIEEEVSYLYLVQYRKRFGAVSLPAEGFCSVATPPKHRQKGYVSKLMRKSIERAAQRVNALFLLGIEGLYSKYGFVCCWPRCRIEVQTRHAEAAPMFQHAIFRPLEPKDADWMSALYNASHAIRPCTVLRDAETCPGPSAPEDWHPGQAAIALERNGTPVGYVVYDHETFGSTRPVNVAELVGADVEAVQALIRFIADMAIEKRRERISIWDMPDSCTGRVLRRLGCYCEMRYSPDGEGMGLICNREPFVLSLQDELKRRAGISNAQALADLAEGKICPDNGLLLQLITGYQSLQEAQEMGLAVPEEYLETMKRWFPGGGTPDLPYPCLYPLDHY